MTVEIWRLALGVALMLFHRPLGEFIIEQEHVIVGRMRQRGLVLPNPIRPATAANVLFLVGVYISLFVLMRIWTLVR